MSGFGARHAAKTIAAALEAGDLYEPDEDEAEEDPGPAPCESCPWAPRCAERRIACSQFVGYTVRRPFWQVLPRVDASRERYRLIFG